MKSAEIFSDNRTSPFMFIRDLIAKAIATKPWLALIAFVCGAVSVLAMTEEGMPTVPMSSAITVLAFLGIAFGGLSIRHQLCEKTASAAMFFSVTSLIALGGYHLQ